MSLFRFDPVSAQLLEQSTILLCLLICPFGLGFRPLSTGGNQLALPSSHLRQRLSDAIDEAVVFVSTTGQ